MRIVLSQTTTYMMRFRDSPHLATVTRLECHIVMWKAASIQVHRADLIQYYRHQSIFPKCCGCWPGFPAGCHREGRQVSYLCAQCREHAHTHPVVTVVSVFSKLVLLAAFTPKTSKVLVALVPVIKAKALLTDKVLVVVVDQPDPIVNFAGPHCAAEQ